MRYLMRQQLFAWGEDFIVKDAPGAPAFCVDGRDFSIGDQRSFQNLEGNELAFINQELFTRGATDSSYRDATRYAPVKRAVLGLGAPTFSLGVPRQTALTAAGDFAAHAHRCRRADAVVAAVTRQWFTPSDTYGVELADPEDVIPLLAATVAIDRYCNHQQETE